MTLGKFCLSKGFLFGPKRGLHKCPFLFNIEVNPYRIACFANFKGKNKLNSVDIQKFGNSPIPNKNLDTKQNSKL